MATEGEANLVTLLALLDSPRRSGRIAGVGGRVNTGADSRFFASPNERSPAGLVSRGASSSDGPGHV